LKLKQRHASKTRVQPVDAATFWMGRFADHGGATVTNSSSKYLAVIAEIDAANASDPRREIDGGSSRPREVVYSERMSACLDQLYPSASEELRIAARAQHIRRWEIPRSTYPLGRDGYNAWRSACREHHGQLTATILRRHGFEQAQIAHVAKIIKKEDLKRDPDSQALENVVAVVFARFYLADFMAVHKDYDEARLVEILRKTLRKMDAAGHAAVLGLALPGEVKRVVDLALKAPN
jgi:Domain of unknown function (DUF4202)